MDRILAQPRATHFETWERPQPTLRELREQFGTRISDEELLLRFMHSEEEVRDVLSRGGQVSSAPHKASNIVQALTELIPAARSMRHFSFSGPELSIELRKEPEAEPLE
jgi:oxaloacetate decarboxylase alpha subunit